MLDEDSRSWIVQNVPFVSAEVKQQAMKRIITCHRCPELTPKINRCKQCGCLMPAKVFLEKARCPLDKW